MLHVLLTAFEATDPLVPGSGLVQAAQMAGVAASVVATARALRAAGLARVIGISRRMTAGAALLSVLGTLGFASESTAYGVDERVAALLEKGGKEAVLEELPKLTNDRVQGAYVVELLRQTRLNEPALRRVLAVAVREIGSDSELAEVLIAMERSYALDGSLRRDFLAAADGISARHERGRVADALLQQEGAR